MATMYRHLGTEFFFVDGSSEGSSIYCAVYDTSSRRKDVGVDVSLKSKLFATSNSQAATWVQLITCLNPANGLSQSSQAAFIITSSSAVLTSSDKTDENGLMLAVDHMEKLMLWAAVT